MSQRHPPDEQSEPMRAHVAFAAPNQPTHVTLESPRSRQAWITADYRDVWYDPDAFPERRP